jgi:hypothetical protein
VKVPPKLLPPAAIVAERDWLTNERFYGQFFRSEWQPILDRLCKDAVWDQLRKRKPVVGRAQLIDLWTRARGLVTGDTPDESVSDKDVALRAAFLESFFLAVFGERTITTGEIKKRADAYRERAERLRDEAGAFLREGAGICNFFDLPVGDPQEHAQALNRAAAWYEAEADQLIVLIDHRDQIGKPGFQHPLFEDARLIVGRHQKLPEVRAYCVLLAKRMRALYGADLRGMVAAIATTALGNRVTEKDVQYWGENKGA